MVIEWDLKDAFESYARGEAIVNILQHKESKLNALASFGLGCQKTSFAL